MKVIRTEIPEVLLLEPQVFEDARGTLFESYNRATFAKATGLDVEFVQDNRSRSGKHVLRGLHYQVVRPQGKLIQVLCGEIFDVALDLRRSSPTFRLHVSFTLSAAHARMIWIPPGFAHGFLSLSEPCEVLYKLTDFRFADQERTLAWDDAGVKWPLDRRPTVSAKDAAGTPLAKAETFA
jgi:dTDP-4-dehydrorhamnose 3,5-epimerase